MYTKINEKDSAMKLGAIYSKEKTTFTLFSPVADSVFVIFMIREMIRLRQAGLRWCAERESFAVFFCYGRG